jgi:hypothetical protein
MIESLFKYYLENQETLVEKYNGKYIVITKDGVKGAYNTVREGYDKAVNRFGKGNFMLQLCTPGDAAYTRYYQTSRVTF